MFARSQAAQSQKSQEKPCFQELGSGAHTVRLGSPGGGGLSNLS